MNTIKVQMSDITKYAIGPEPVNHSPSFDYCRKLIKQGFSEDTRLDVYRGEMLCLTVPNIGVGAKLKIEENAKFGPRIVKYRNTLDQL